MYISDHKIIGCTLIISNKFFNTYYLHMKQRDITRANHNKAAMQQCGCHLTNNPTLNKRNIEPQLTPAE